MIRKNFLLSITKPLIDILLISILFVLFTSLGNYKFNTDILKVLLLTHFIWLIFSKKFNLYDNQRFERFLTYFKRLSSTLFCFLIYCFIGFPLLLKDLFSDFSLIVFLISFSFLFFIFSLFYFYTLKLYAKKGFNSKNILILGLNNNTFGFIDLLKNRKEFGLHIKDIFVVKNPQENQTLLNLSNLNHYLVQNEIDFAYISLGNGMDDEMVTAVTNILEDKYIPIGFIPSSSLEIRQSLEINYLDSFPILTYKKYPLDHAFNQFTKRTFDLFFTVVVFAFLLWWLLPLISIMVYFSQGRPILFKQKRNGLNGKEFDCLKFRTMKPHKFNDIKPTERDDPRVTKLGKILRKTSLDELPQFINVLKGEMSIVGPRPHMVSENESYSDIIKRYSLRHYVKPGITGLAQVKGYRGAIDSDKDMEMRIRTDIYYVRNWSFLLDLFIIYKTAKLMIFGDENAI